MKTALQLMGTDYDSSLEVLASDTRKVGMRMYQLTAEQLELVARRAREEMRDMAEAVCNECDWSVAAAYKIADLPVAP